MYHLFICDDQKKVKDYIKVTIETVASKHNLNISTLFLTDTAEELINSLSNSPSYFNIYILDIELQSTMDGIELGKEIRKKDPLGHIIYLTNYQHYLKNIVNYYIYPYAYIEKDSLENLINQFEQIFLSIHNNFEAIKESRQFFQFTFNYKQYKIAVDDIIFFEYTGNHRIILNTINNRYEFYYESFKSITECSENLVLVHRSYIINKRAIKYVNFKEKTLLLTGDFSCPFSRINKAKIQSMFKQAVEEN